MTPNQGDPILSQLEALAKEAPRGPWINPENDHLAVVYDGCYLVAQTHQANSDVDVQCARYIAAANPQAILALIERLRKAEAKLERICAYSTTAYGSVTERDQAVEHLMTISDWSRAEYDKEIGK